MSDTIESGLRFLGNHELRALLDVNAKLLVGSEAQRLVSPISQYEAEQVAKRLLVISTEIIHRCKTSGFS